MRKLTLSTLMILLFSSGGWAQPWSRITSFEGGDFNTLYTNDSFIWIGSNGGGIYRSPASSNNFTYRGEGLNSIFAKNINSIRKKGNMLVCATNFGLHTSIDNGDNWDLAVNGLDWFDTPYYILEQAADTFYTWDFKASSNEYSLYWSANPANGWNKGATLPSMSNMASFGQRMLIFNNDSIVLLHHSSNLELLSKTGLPNDFRCFRMAGYQNTGILAKNEDSIFSYTGSGPWTSAMNGIPAGVITYGLYDISDTIYTFGYTATDLNYTLYRSVDGGLNWSSPSGAQLALNLVNDLERIPGGLMAVTIDGLWFLPDGGSAWEKRQKGVYATSHRYPYVLGNTVINLVREFGYTKSTDEFGSWSFADNGLSSYQLNSYNYSQLIQANSNYYILDLFEDTLYRSLDLGDTWTKVILPWSMGYTGFYMLGALDNTIWVEGTRNNGTQYMMFISRDGGNTWDSTAMPLNEAFGNIVKVGTNWYLNTRNAVYKTTDEGDSWSPSNNGLPSQMDGLAGLSQFNGRLFVIRKYFDNIVPAYADSIYSSDNGGETWTGIPASGLPLSARIDFLTVSNGVIYISTNQGLFYTENNGQNWINFNSNLPVGILVTGMSANVNTLYLTTQSFGMWKNTISSHSGIAYREPKQPGWLIFPNPATSNIEVQGIAVDEKVRIIDLQGRVIKSLAYPAQGGIDVSDLQNGLYFLQSSTSRAEFLISR